MPSTPRDYGLKIEGKVGADLKAIVDRSRGIAQRMNGGVGFLMKKNKVDVIWGEAQAHQGQRDRRLQDRKKPMEPQAPLPKNTKGEGTYTAKHIIVATGARPRALPGIEPDGKLIWTYFEAMVPKEMPKSLLVMGSGAIGIEFASFYRTMGVEVTVVELLPAGHAGRGCRDLGLRQEAVREAGHEDPARGQGDQGREDRRELGHRACRDEGRQGREDHRRPA